jgi:hypothetical protein
MNDERTGKRQPCEQERELQAARDQLRYELDRKPERTEQGEWRGVCGDRHTD